MNLLSMVGLGTSTGSPARGQGGGFRLCYRNTWKRIFWGGQERVNKRNKLNLSFGQRELLHSTYGRSKKNLLKTYRADLSA